MVNQDPLGEKGELPGVPWLPTGKLLTVLVPGVERMAFPWIECLLRDTRQILCLLYLPICDVPAHVTYLGIRPQALGLFIRVFTRTFPWKSQMVDLTYWSFSRYFLVNLPGSLTRGGCLHGVRSRALHFSSRL